MISKTLFSGFAAALLTSGLPPHMGQNQPMPLPPQIQESEVKAPVTDTTVSDKIVKSLATGLEARYVIAILDTGYNPAEATTKLKLCDKGHYDARTKTNNPNWSSIHGTRVANIIAEKLKDVDYCVQVINYWIPGEDLANVEAVGNALEQVGKEARVPDAMNISSEGFGSNSKEEAAMRRLAEAGTQFFVAAGNSSKNLDLMCTSYPACYDIDNLTVVGMQDDVDPKVKSKQSNYGKRVDVWAPGYALDKEGNKCAEGTSFAAPRALSEYILFVESKRLEHEKTTKGP